MTTTITTKTMKRCGIYVYWDKDGVLRSFAHYFISELRTICNRVVVVVNGQLTPESRLSLQNLNVEFFVRENKGYDFYAYQAGLKHLGYQTLEEYDEVILCNSSVYGPVVSWENTFKTMEQKDVDFWGITQWHGHPWKDHIQSYFLVFRKTLTKSTEFKHYWDNLPSVQSWEVARAKCETELTDHFARSGFKWDTFLSKDRFKDYCPDPTIQCSNELLSLGSPLLKRKALCLDYDFFIQISYGKSARESLKYIKEKTSYNLQLIYDDLLQTQPQSTWRLATHHTFALPLNVALSGRDISSLKTALVFFVYFKDLVDEVIQHILSMPKNSDIFIVSANESLLSAYKDRLDSSDFNKIEYRLQINRGRNEMAYFVTCRDVVESYDYCCLMHDKKSAHNKPLLKGKSMMQHHYDTLLASRCYVENILRTFEENPHIGLLMPPTPMFADWTKCLINTPLTICGNKCLELVDKLKIKAPFDQDPVFPVGTMFWIRKGAMKALYRHDWCADDFPQEPLPTDGTLLHAMERLYPLIAQESGYCTAWVMSDRYAEIYADNLYFQLKNEVRSKELLGSNPDEQDIKTRDLKRIFKLYIKQKFKKLKKHL